MREALVLALATAAVLLGPIFSPVAAQDQSTSVRLTPDINGVLQPGMQIGQTKSRDGQERTERIRSINGESVPVERAEERVLRDDANGRVVERTVRRYDATGNPLPPEKTLIEEQKHDGGSTIRTTTYRSDVNGNSLPAERSVTEIHESGLVRNSETSVERPTINGFQTVEKSTVVREGSDADYHQTTVVYRPGSDGFYPAVQQVTSHVETPGNVTDNTAEYERGATGSLELRSQTVVRGLKRPDGGETREVDHLGLSAPGTVGASDSTLKLQERDIVERRVEADGSTVETVSARRPAGDPGVLGPSKLISETVCRGKCQ